MLVENLFHGGGFDFCDRGPSVLVALMRQVLSGVDFNGVNDFVEFYIKTTANILMGVRISIETRFLL